MGLVYRSQPGRHRANAIQVVVGPSSDNEHSSDSSNHTTYKTEGLTYMRPSTIILESAKCIDKEGGCWPCHGLRAWAPVLLSHAYDVMWGFL